MPMSMFCFIDNNFHDVWLGFLRPGDIQNRDCLHDSHWLGASSILQQNGV